ncbi:hypothetical protein GWK47_051857 [Chionoecetes opilio]|uniref:Uncharacterized protein n=1 Tax=Chionoecetes opilio TaxID=41210 RepID=A0A8J4Y8M5_CHIOP|nr:hypothetical protein GWK47_051857 [Chionoecetes opilio]
MLLLDVSISPPRGEPSTLQLLANLSTNSITERFFWLFLSGGHCPQLVDDMNAPAALMVHHVGSQDVEVGRKLDFPLRIRSIVDRLNDSMALQGVLTRCRTSFWVVSITAEEAFLPGNRTLARGGTRGGGWQA